MNRCINIVELAVTPRRAFDASADVWIILLRRGAEIIDVQTLIVVMRDRI
jgi:hypothetical protein